METKTAIEMSIEEINIFLATKVFGWTNVKKKRPTSGGDWYDRMMASKQPLYIGGTTPKGWDAHLCDWTTPENIHEVIAASFKYNLMLKAMPLENQVLVYLELKDSYPYKVYHCFSNTFEEGLCRTLVQAVMDLKL